MPVIEWSEALQLGDAATDANHAEFCALLNAIADASDAEFIPALDAFIDHTEHHFGEENAWMDAADFPVVDVSVEHFDGDAGHSATSVARGTLGT